MAGGLQGMLGTARPGVRNAQNAGRVPQTKHPIGTVRLFSVLVAAIDESRKATSGVVGREVHLCVLPHGLALLIAGAELSHGMVIDSCAWEHVACTIRHGRSPIISKNSMYSCRDTCTQAPARGDWQSASRAGRGRPWSEVAVPLVDVCTIAFLSRSYRRSRHQTAIGP